jgi:hypothetical protein
LGGSVHAAASVASAGRRHGPGRAITAADKISLNDCLTGLMIFDGGDFEFTRDFRPTRRDFRPTRTVLADDAIHAQGTKSDNIFS